jgi:putative endonuclease
MGIAGERGRAAEIIAAATLELSGLRIEAHNVRLAGAEVDLLAAEGRTQVVVEVKFRNRSDYGGAAGAVDRRKRERLLRAASALIAQGHGEVRIDVVTVELVPGGAEVRHHRGAVVA